MTAERCPSCGGEWVDGRIAVPIVGSLRFVYRLGTNEVATEVAAQMCGDCGAVQLRARDPQAIVRAQRAAAHARPTRRSRRSGSDREG
jgi:Zn-finger nucleic acid-binding protein